MSETVQLPRRDIAGANVAQKPIWALHSVHTDTLEGEGVLPKLEPPLKTMCDAHLRPDAVCCKEIKGQERKLINPDIVRDVILGLSDGLTVPFGLTAGLAALGTSHVVVIGGVAELISGSLSMGVGGFLSAMAERDHYRYTRDLIRARIKRSCAGEIEREVTKMLGEVGLEETLCRRVALGLLEVESQIDGERRTLLEKHTSRSSSYARYVQPFLRTIARKARTNHDEEEVCRGVRVPAADVGLTAFLLRYAEGEKEVPNSRLFTSAFTIGISYALGGLIPLLPYILEHNAYHALFISTGVTGLTLLVFGVLKAYYTGSRIGFVGYTKSALYTLATGALAAGSAYGISRAIEGRPSDDQ